MPVNILAQVFSQGLDSVPYGWTVVKVAPVLALLYLLKWFFNGAVNGSERNMHSKVIMVTVRLSLLDIRRLSSDDHLGWHSWHWSRSSQRSGFAWCSDHSSCSTAPLRSLPRRLHRRCSHTDRQRAHYSRKRRPRVST